MLRADFDDHALWATTSQMNRQLAQVQEAGVVSEVAVLETIGFYVSHIESFKPLASQYVSLFTDNMLTNVYATLAAASNQLQSRIDIGTSGSGYLENARAQAESTLDQMGPWPRPYGKGGQVQQMETLFEGLLERQRQATQQLDESHGRLHADLSRVEEDLTQQQQRFASELQTFQNTAATIATSVDAEKARVDEVVSKGLDAVSETQRSGAEQYRDWRSQQEEKFAEDFTPFRQRIEHTLQEAEESLSQLRRTKTEFANLTSVAAGDTLASNYQREADTNRQSGIWCYVIGGVFLLAAAVPFVLLLADSSLDRGQVVEWGRIAVRVSLGAVAGSAATIAVRLGGRFLSQAERSRRMELELRAFDPFFANVEDRDRVDTARLELVDRTFGRSEPSTSTRSDEVVTVSSLERLTASVAKILNR